MLLARFCGYLILAAGLAALGCSSESKQPPPVAKAPPQAEPKPKGDSPAEEAPPNIDVRVPVTSEPDVPTPSPSRGLFAETPGPLGGLARALTRAAARSDQPATTPAKERDTMKPSPAAPAADAALAAVPLIPRKELFGNPDKAAARMSSEGKLLSYLAPVDGVLNIWVGPIDDPAAAKPVTQDKKRGIRMYQWAFTNKHILYTQDQDGDEDFHIYCVNLATNETKDLTPLNKVNAQIEAVSELFPNEILVGLNDRDPELHDIHRINLETGERTLVQENPGFVGFLTDHNFQVRFGSQFGPDGLTILQRTDSAEQPWKEFAKIGMEDAMTTSPAGFDKTNSKLYFIDSRNRDTGALTVLDLATGKQDLVAENPRADIADVMAHPTEKTVQAVGFTYARKEWQVLDPAVGEDLKYLQGVADGEIEITARTLDDARWIVAYRMDNGPIRYYRYDRQPRQATFLFTNRDSLAKWPLVKMHSVTIKARDGLELVGYLSLPPGSDDDGDARPNRPVPLVLEVHGGPWARDNWGLDPGHQLLANRGYAVLNVNFRGSTGFGKKFINASNREWSGKMHDDLLDAVEWAVTEKIAERDKVAIMGGSYGGYATLVGLTFTPDVFACGVDIVGPSSLVTLLNNVPPYWGPFMPVMKERVGDHSTPEGIAELNKRSPLSYVEKIQRPLLIGQGANDPRVTKLEAEQIVAAMQSKQIPVTYVVFPDEGHGFARPENSLAFNAVTEAFLAQHLGGRFEPIGVDFTGSTVSVPVGAEQVPGLAESLPTAEE